MHPTVMLGKKSGILERPNVNKLKIICFEITERFAVRLILCCDTPKVSKIVFTAVGTKIKQKNELSDAMQ